MADGRMRDRSEGLWARIRRFALTDVGALMRGLNAEDLERMERVLIEADFGVPATIELTQALEDEVRKGKLKTEEDLRRTLEGRGRLATIKLSSSFCRLTGSSRAPSTCGKLSSSSISRLSCCLSRHHPM